MDGLIAGPTGANRPVFVFKGHADLTASAIPTGQLSLSGPSVKLDAAHWPVRGDLAHVRLAGKVFVAPRGVNFRVLIGPFANDQERAAAAGTIRTGTGSEVVNAAP